MGWLTFIMAVAVTVRIACWAAHADRAQWAGKQLIYHGQAFGLAMIVGGAWGVVLRYEYADIILLIGVSTLLLINRRSPFRGGK